MLPEDQLKISILRQHFTLENQGKKKEEKKVEVLNVNEKKKQFNTNNKNNKNKDKKCFKCGYQGHISTECRTSQKKIDEYKKLREEEKEKERHALECKGKIEKYGRWQPTASVDAKAHFEQAKHNS